MKRASILCLLLVCCAILFALPAGAAAIWDNGPASGQIGNTDISPTATSQTWDSFNVTGPPVTMRILTFGGWLEPGDVLLNVNMDINTQANNGGTLVFSGSSTVIQMNCVSSSDGNSVCFEAVDLLGNGPTLTAGTYWLRLYNGLTQYGNASVGWDINAGRGCMSAGCPSLAVDESGNPIASESFTIYPGLGQQPTPEPGSLLLLGTAVVGLAGALRRKMMR